VSLWMSTTSGTLGGLVNKYLPASFSGYQVFSSGGNLCAWYFRDATNYVWDRSGCTLATPGFNDGQWHHVAFTVDSSGGSLFVDGTLRMTQPWTGTPGATTTTQDLSLAQYPGTASPFLAGRIDDVRIYNRALSAGEVSFLSTLVKVRPAVKTEGRAARQRPEPVAVPAPVGVIPAGERRAAHAGALSQVTRWREERNRNAPTIAAAFTRQKVYGRLKRGSTPFLPCCIPPSRAPA